VSFCVRLLWCHFLALFLSFVPTFRYLSSRMTRRKTVGKKKSAGRKPDFTGRRLLFLQAFAPQWQQSVDADKQSDFYNKITSKAIKIWGYHDNYNQDLIDDDQDDDDDEPIDTTLEHNDDDDDDDLDAEEVDRRQKIYSKLRTVS
jgi:hypothetical protein